MFLALLLSSFGGDALNSGDKPEEKLDIEPDKTEKRKTRIQMLVEWTKKKKKKKKKLDKKDADGMDRSLPVVISDLIHSIHDLIL